MITFNNHLGKIRLLLIDDEPWFLAKDICTILNRYISIVHGNVSEPNKRILTKDEIAKYNSGDNSYPKTPSTFVNLTGLYAVLVKADTSESNQLSTWVSNEIIPSLKTPKIPEKIESLSIFTSPVFGTIRTIIINDEPFFVGKDIAEALGYANTKDALERHVDSEDKQIIQKSCFPTLEIPNRGMTVINESGVYALIFGSKLPSAKKFKHWVTSEVLPQIRKTGGYVNDDELFISTYLPFADENTKTMFRGMLSTVRKQNDLINKKEQEIIEMTPKAEFADTVHTSTSLLLIKEFGKIISTTFPKLGPSNLYKFLREQKILYNIDEYHKNIPYQEYVKKGYFCVKEKVSHTPEPFLYSVTYVTGKGQIFIYKLAESIYGKETIVA